MNLNALRAALHRSPFQPFGIRLADGGYLSIWLPATVAMSEHQVIVANPVDDSFTLLEPSQIAAIETTELSWSFCITS